MRLFRSSDYFITKCGKVFNVKSKKWLKPTVDRYEVVNLVIKGIRSKFYVHRLVAEVYLKDFKEGLTVNHIDGNKLNNNVSNLECISVAENIKHAYKNNLIKGTKKNNKKRIDKQNVLMLYIVGYNITQIATKLKISRTSASKILKYVHSN